MNLWFRNTGDVQWGTATNWSTTSDLATPAAAIPTVSDAVFFIAGSGNCSFSTTTRNALSVDFTGYSGTLTGSGTLSVSGNVTLSPTMVISSTGPLAINAAATLISNGKIWPNTLTFGTGTNTYTMADNWTVLNVNTTGAGTKTVNGGTLTVQGNYTGTIAMNGSVTLLFTGTSGTATWSNTGSMSVNTVNINTGANSFTFTSNFTIYSDFIYTSGNVITTGTTITFGFGSNAQNYTGAGITWNNISFNSAGTITLLSDMNIAGTVTNLGKTISGAGKNLNVGSLTVTGSFGGSANIVFNGTGTWSGNFNVSLSIVINTSGTITISGTVSLSGNLIYNSGTVITTGSTLVLGGSTQNISTGSIQWNNVNISTTDTLTITGSFNVIGTMTVPSATVTFGGTGTVTVANLQSITAGASTASINPSLTNFIITNSVTCASTIPGTSYIVKSSIAGTRAKLTLQAGATCNIGYYTFTDIDASGGRPIYTFGGIVNNCLNVNVQQDPVYSFAKNYAA